MTIQLKSADQITFWISQSGYLCFQYLNQTTDEHDVISLTPDQFYSIASYVNDRKQELTELWNNGYTVTELSDEVAK